MSNIFKQQGRGNKFLVASIIICGLVLIAPEVNAASGNSASLNLNLDSQKILNNINFPTSIPILGGQGSLPSAGTSVQTPQIDFKQFFNLQSISQSDWKGAAKAIGILAINIFLVVISITSQLLKLLLDILKGL